MITKTEPKSKRKPAFKLELQVKDGSLVDYQPLAGMGVLVTPAIDEDYWLFRVAVSDKQAIIGFSKFGTLGIGFQHEEDWNTNLPYNCGVSQIYDHIKHNKGDSKISKSRCIKAIQMIIDAWEKVK